MQSTASWTLGRNRQRSKWWLAMSMACAANARIRSATCPPSTLPECRRSGASPAPEPAPQRRAAPCEQIPASSSLPVVLATVGDVLSQSIAQDRRANAGE